MSEAENAQRAVAQRMPVMHSEVGQALAVLTDVVVSLVAVTERIADRLDSWTHEPEPPPAHADTRAHEYRQRGPELRVRRW